MSDAAYGAGVEEHSISGTRVHVSFVAKAVVDCFKYRNGIGPDIAIEELQEVVRRRTVPPFEIMHYACGDRVEAVIGPYPMALM